MPRTRSQAGVSPLVSLDAPRRTRRVAASSKTISASQEGVTAKLKRARKTKTDTAAEASPDESRGERDAVTTSEEPHPVTPNPKEPQEENHKSQEPEQHTDTETNETPAASDNSVSPLKRKSFRLSMGKVKSALKKPSESFRQRLSLLKRSWRESSEYEEKMITFEPTPGTQYSLSEDQILDAAATILLERMDSNAFDQPGPTSSNIRCPCCDDPLSCSNGHDFSWAPEDVKQKVNALLTTILTEGICVATEKKQEELETEGRRRAAKQRSQENPTQPVQPAQTEKLETAKPKGKKRAAPSSAKPEQATKRSSRKRTRSNTDDDSERPDGEPSTQRPRLTPKHPSTYRRRATAPRRKYTHAQLRQRANDWENGNRPPSMFRLDEAIAQHEQEAEQEEAARKAAEEAAEDERLEMISRAAMERHTVLGQVPENLDNSLQVPIYNDPVEDPVTPPRAQAAEAPETPGSSTWGFQVRNLFSSVGNSMSRFVPRFRTVTDQAVPFVAGGGETPAVNNHAAARAEPAPANADMHAAGQDKHAENDQKAMDLTYSLYPPAIKIPSPPSPVQPVTKPTTTQAAGTETPLQSSEQGGNAAADSAAAAAAAAATASHTISRTADLNRRAETSATGQSEEAHKEPGKKTKRKRQRSPSPEVIPNPPGTSYGLDLDYFTFYSTDEEASGGDTTDEEEPSLPADKPAEKRVRIESPPRTTQRAQETVPNAARTETQAPAPYIPPGWNRPTTTVYNGTLFQGRTPTISHTQGEPQTRGWPPQVMDSARMSQAKSHSGSLLDIREDHQRKHMLRSQNQDVNNSIGNTQTPRHAPTTTRAPQASFSRPSQQQPAVENGAGPSANAGPSADAGPTKASPPNGMQSPSATTQPSASASFQPSAPTTVQPATTPSSFQSPATTAEAPAPSRRDERTTTTNGASPFHNAEPLLPTTRDATEKHKPKSPSKLREPILFSSPVASSPDREAEKETEAETEDDDDLRQVFGYDEAGQQAYELFQSCPSGDLTKLSWPKFASVPDDDIQRIVNATNYTAGHEDEIRNTFQQSFHSFQKDLSEGLVDTNELLEGLPI